MATFHGINMDEARQSARELRSTAQDLDTIVNRATAAIHRSTWVGGTAQQMQGAWAQQVGALGEAAMLLQQMATHIEREVREQQAVSNP